MSSIPRAVLDRHLAHATGSTQWYVHWTRALIYTEGVREMAEKAGAYWLIDAVASHVRHTTRASIRRQPFQVWTLAPYQNGKPGATLTMRRDADAQPEVRQRIEYTDFPLHSDGGAKPFQLWLVAGDLEAPTLLLPSEY